MATTGPTVLVLAWEWVTQTPPHLYSRRVLIDQTDDLAVIVSQDSLDEGSSYTVRHFTSLEAAKRRASIESGECEDSHYLVNCPREVQVPLRSLRGLNESNQTAVQLAAQEVIFCALGYNPPAQFQSDLK